MTAGAGASLNARLRWPWVSPATFSLLKSAVRAAIVLPAVFAVAHLVIGQPQTALFAAFGTFAMLVLAEFGGPARTRLLAYLSLAGAGGLLVVLGTVCAQRTWLATAAMAVTGFIILFLGMVNGFAAAGVTAAVLAFVLAVSVPVPLAVLPARLTGWGLAAGAAITAAMLMWPPRVRSTLPGAAARACAALASLADALASDQAAVAERSATAQREVAALRDRLAATPHRITGPAGRAAALASLISELGWLCTSLTALAEAERADLCRVRNSQALTAVAGVLRDSGRLLTGQRAEPRTESLQTAQEAVASTLAQRIQELPPVRAERELESGVGRSFRVHAIAQTTRQIAAYAVGACGREAGLPALAAGSQPAAPGVETGTATEGHSGHGRWEIAARSAISRLKVAAGGHAGTRSVWFRNSARGAAGLAIAVLVAHTTGLQYSFWVVLGALSVLRSSAFGTSRSVMAALAGTAAGIGIGAAVLVPAVASDVALWLLLPPTLLLAAYTPRVFPFAVGQAAFTVAVLVLFNIINPIGWTVGLIRIQDVAIGCGISLAVGLIFWPGGASALLRRHLATAYAVCADYAVAAVDRLADSARGDLRQAGHAAATAVHLLDDAFRGYLAEQSPKRMAPERAALLVAGADRLLHAGQSLAALDALPNGGQAAQPCGEPLREEAHALRAWYVTLADSLARSAPVPPPQRRDPPSRGPVLSCVRRAIVSHRGSLAHDQLQLLWASQHLNVLWRLESNLGQSAATAGAPATARSRTPYTSARRASGQPQQRQENLVRTNDHE